MGVPMGAALKIRDDLTPTALRARARRDSNGRAAARMYAIANALEGMTRAEAARLAGMERQALRDAVVRYNGEGIDGLYDRPKGHPPRRLNAHQEAELRALIVRGADPEKDGISSYTLADICRLVEERFGQSYHPGAMWWVLRRLRLSWQKARPSHPKGDPAAREAFKKGGSPVP